MKEWIDTKFDHKLIQNGHFTFTSKQKDVTCLCFTSGYSFSRTVQQLIKAGAEVTATDSLGNTPLHRAVGGNVKASVFSSSMAPR